MSLFGTFRRTKGKKTSNDSRPGGLLGLDVASSSSKNPTVFSSTPNLHKIDQNVKVNGKLKSIKDFPIKDYEGSGGNSEKVSSAGSKWNFEDRRTSSVAETWTGGGGLSKGPPVKKNSITSSSINRHFVSMLNVMGSLKRSKSIRKFAFGSAMNVSKESSSSVGVTKDFSFTTKAKPKSKTSTSSKSEEFLPELTDGRGPYMNDEDGNSIASGGSSSNYNNNQNISRTNTEPGVISSGSSESGSLHDTNSIRASSEKSDIMEESDEESGGNSVKNPEELERQKTCLLGIKKFNMDHKKGIDFLVEKGILQYTSEDVSRFLKEGVGLSKGSIGNYLGERIDFNEEVLKAFVDRHDFKDVMLVQALRQFLWSFRLPGESQKISRMLDAFAERYIELNPEMFSVDTCSVLCYSIIMLNTEMHNPNVKDKVTVDQFIKRNRGIEGGEALSQSFMVSLYNSVQSEPFRFPEEDGNDLMLTFFNPDIEGWLCKLGGRPKSWKRLWFILSNNCLYFFKFTTDKTPRGIIPLENVLVRVPPDKPGKLHTMILYKESPDPRMIDQIKTCKTLSDGQTVPKLYTSIILGTSSRKEREKWVKSINANHSMSKFYSELTLKKMKMNKSQTHLQPETKVFRKSQISLPATVLGNDMGNVPIPQEVLKDSSKDPQNFFLKKNLSSISLATSVQSMTFPKSSRSRSESRLNIRMKSKSPSMSTISYPEELSKEVDLDRTLTSTAEDLNLEFSESTLKDSEAQAVDLSPVSPTSVSIDVQAETVVFQDKLKKLSLVEENSHSDRSSSETPDEFVSPLPIPQESSMNDTSSTITDERIETRRPQPYSRNDLEDDPSSPPVELISYTRKSSIPAPDDFPLKVLDAPSESIPKLVLDNALETLLLDMRRHISEFESKLPEHPESSNEDLSQGQNPDLNIPPPEAEFSDTCHSIEIIDCRSPDVQTKTFSNSNRFGAEGFSQNVVLTKAPVNYVDSIYESNV